MLRDPSLIPLSHQHHNALALCVLTERSLREDWSEANVARLAQKAADRHDLELTNHFDIEENTLFPEIRARLGDVPMLSELIETHRALTAMVECLRTAPSRELLLEFTGLLRRHIRREENELFENIQERLPREVLDRLGRTIEQKIVRICL